MVEKTSKYNEFASRLSEAMSKKGFTVKDLSQACGVTYEMARRYTLGHAKPRDEKMRLIAAWLDVTPFWLDYGEGPGDEESPLSRPSFGTSPETGADDEFAELSEDEKRLIRTFREFPEAESRNMLLVFEMRLKELKSYFEKYFGSR